ELITKPAQPGKPLFNVKKSRLLHSVIPSVRTGRMESQSRPQNQGVFRTLHLIFHKKNNTCFQHETVLYNG
ncbi:hypothetical protein, partial [Gluconobacter sp. P1D12_c]|uniref:hypothetical protein n=1 Tax=Gluconobacter sp. P1D12_c TaxID=2762614 RepID=UPI001C059DD4